MAKAPANAAHGTGRVSLSSDAGWPTWADQQAVQQLRDAVRLARIGHAYLLSGPKGVGKSDLARAFAQALSCTERESTDRSQPCGRCRACRNVQRRAHPDVEHFDLETQAAIAEKPGSRGTLSIDTVRRLRASAALLPLEASHRLVIVDDAETMLEPAQQALLKTLEEPPLSVSLVLLTDEPEALLPTVRSRCVQVAVRPVPESRVKEALLARDVDEKTAEEIAMLSRGSAAWALAAATDAEVLRARSSERDSAAAWLDSSEYDRLVTAFRLGEQFSKRRSAVIGVVQAAIQILRTTMIETASREGHDSGQLATADGDDLASRVGTAVAASLQCLKDLEANVRPRLALEAMVLQWPRWVPPPA